MQTAAYSKEGRDLFLGLGFTVTQQFEFEEGGHLWFLEAPPDARTQNGFVVIDLEEIGAEWHLTLVQELARWPQWPTCSACGYSVSDQGHCSNVRCVDGWADDHKLPLFHRRRWGAWHLDVVRLCLVHGAGHHEFNIEAISSSSVMLDMIFQTRTLWIVTSQDTADLLQALDDIIDPQANLCSHRQDKRIPDVTEFLLARIRNSGQPPREEAV